MRFFRAADCMPVWMAVLSAAIGIYAAAIAALDAGSVDEALAFLLLWQMLCAPAGFARPASCGHFDPALVGFDRRLLATAHALHAIWPVAAIWAVVAVIDAVVHGGAPRAFEAGRLSAFVFVSVTSWALSLPAPRLLTGALWLALIVAGATSQLGAAQYAAMVARADGTAVAIVHAAALTLVCPFLMVGDHVPPRAPIAVVLAAAAAVAAGAGVLQVCRRNYPLEPSL